MKLACVTILYNPDNNLIKRISTYEPHVYKLIIIDNSEYENLEIKQELLNNPKITLIQNGENGGIARRLNEAAHIALFNKCDWMLTMDQDSYFEEVSFESYLSCMSIFNERDKVALFGVEYNKNLVQPGNCAPEEVTRLITSGTLLNLNAFREIGEFDEELFIDQVDFEYCYRSLLCGYKVIKFKNIYLHHSLGRMSFHRSLKSFRKTERSLHTPVRLYYMTRNYLYVRNKYKKDFQTDIASGLQELLYHIKNNVLYNKQRIRVLKYVLLGIMDFKRNKMGKLSLTHK